LRVLIIEDSEDDTWLLLRELERMGFEVEFERVETADSMQSCLAQKDWDVILSDHTLPLFGAMQALEILRASGRDIPFILISGTIGEETAAAALKAGANDFITKGNYSRLGPAIRRELREAETRRQRKQAEQAYSASQRRFQALIEYAPDGIALLGANGKMRQVTPSTERILGYAPEDIVDQDPALLTHPDDLPALLGILTDLFQHPGKVVRTEYRFLHKDGSWRWLESTISNLLEEPSVQAIVFNYRDVTERKRYEEELESLNLDLEQRVTKRTAELNLTNMELERANRVKDEFLATMSHELRTPLNSILGLSESLMEQRSGTLNDYQGQSIQLIQSSGRHLLELINDILDVSKINAGKFEIYPQILDVNVLCRSSLAFVREQAMRKSITLSSQEDTTVSEIYADPRRLKQILVNLLTNAVKFTPEHGQVLLRVHVEVENNLVQITVTDTGIGIAPENLKRLFNPFVQVDSKLNRQFEGTGLGLSLVQKLTDLHGGSVMVESEIGKGSQFTINLPWDKNVIVQQNSAEARGKLLSPLRTEKHNMSLKNSVNRRKILLAEDNIPNAITISEYLESWGYEIIIAHDGLEALEQAETKEPDIILMDIQMPVMDGLEAIRHFRANPRFVNTPIIALTALAMPGDRERCLEAGASEYMSKPVSLKTLAKTIETMLDQ
jgi:PAS domain S-box-containing protein